MPATAHSCGALGIGRAHVSARGRHAYVLMAFANFVSPPVLLLTASTTVKMLRCHKPLATGPEACSRVGCRMLGCDRTTAVPVHALVDSANACI